MKTYTQLINELKLPSKESGIGIGPMLRRAISPRARKLKKAVDKRNSPLRKSKVKWRAAEDKLNRDMNTLRGDSGVTDINTPWTTSTNAAT